MKTIELTKGKIAFVDDGDFENVNQFNWCAMWNGKKWYVVRKEFQNHPLIYLHRFLMKPKLDQEIDHINNDGLDNRRSNLRLCSHAENNRAVKNKYKKGYSKWRGITWDKRFDTWYARITKNQVTYHLGCFDSAKEAALAYDMAARKYFGEFVNLNFP